MFVKPKHTGGSYESLQTSYTNGAGKSTILFGKGILGYKDCQRAGTEQGDHISRAAEEYQPRQISSKHRGGPVSEAPEEMPEEKTAGGRGTAGVRPG